VPDRILTTPIIVSFIVSVVHFATLYQLRVRPRIGQAARIGLRGDVGAVDGCPRRRLRQ
jgi:hypothetical protein